MASIKELLGDNIQLYDSMLSKASFNIRCCIPGIIQKYNPNNNTAEIQPAIREEVVNEDNSVSYVNLPLLINVPLVFLSSKNSGITFPVQQNDECLVFFSDLSYDNFWMNGNVQNPVEVRRHDLSDGIAIPCNISLVNTEAVENKLKIKYGNTSIVLDGSEIHFIGYFGSLKASNIVSPDLDTVFTDAQKKKVRSSIDAMQGIDNGNGCYYVLNNGVVEWINPPMIIGTEYRTIERYQGKPVYTKIVDCGSAPAKGGITSTTLPANSQNQWIVSSMLTYYGITFPRFNASTALVSMYVYLAAGSGVIQVFSPGEDRSGNGKVIVTIKYTKSTD